MNPLARISRNQIQTAIRYLTWFGALFLLWVSIQYMFIGSGRAIPVVKYVRIHVEEFKQHDVRIIQKQQIPFVLIHRTQQQIDDLKQQHKGSNALRSVMDEYFIAIALGTEFSCVINKHSEGLLKESCGQARYDYSGRSVLENSANTALLVPQMNYNKSTNTFNLTLK